MRSRARYCCNMVGRDEPAVGHAGDPAQGIPGSPQPPFLGVEVDLQRAVVGQSCAAVVSASASSCARSPRAGHAFGGAALVQGVDEGLRRGDRRSGTCAARPRPTRADEARTAHQTARPSPVPHRSVDDDLRRLARPRPLARKACPDEGRDTPDRPRMRAVRRPRRRSAGRRPTWCGCPMSSGTSPRKS